MSCATSPRSSRAQPDDSHRARERCRVRHAHAENGRSRLRAGRAPPVSSDSRYIEDRLGEWILEGVEAGHIQQPESNREILNGSNRYGF